MKTIWSFAIPMQHEITIEMPVDADLLTVQLQQGVPTLWAIVDPQKARWYRRLVIVGTGQEEPSGRYVGTWQNVGFVWHLFDLGSQKQKP